jgi:putative DNA primase/helicase
MSSNGFPFAGSLKSDSQLHRFSRDSKKNQLDEWYVCYEGISARGNPYLVCCYGTWSGNQERFVYKSYDSSNYFSYEELPEIRAKEEVRKKQLEIQLKEDREKRISDAQEAWAQAIEDPTSKRQFAYLERKQVKAYGVKYGFDAQGHPVVVIPLCNSDGEIQAVQHIQKDGTKRIYGAKKGNFHVLGIIEDGDLIHVTEGYATAASIHEGTKSPVVVAFDCGNLHSVVGNLRSKYPNSKIVIAADNDIETVGNPGKTKAEEAAKAYGCSVVVPTFPQDLKLPNDKLPTDFNDLHVHCGIEEAVRQLQQARQIEQSPCFQFRSAHSLIQDPPKVNWLIKSYIDTGSLSMLFGAPGSMKSFLAIDMGYCIATGRAWHGCPVRKSGPVFYIAGEGFAGLAKRFRAWSLANNVDLRDVPFFSSNRPAQLLDQASAFEVVQAIDELKSLHGAPVFIIIDTLNRNFGPGDEIRS